MGSKGRVLTWLLTTLALAMVVQSAVAETEDQYIARLLSTRLKPSDLQRPSNRLLERINQIGLHTEAFTQPELEVGNHVRGAPRWHVVLVRVLGEDRTAMLLRQSGAHVVASLLPPLTNDPEGPQGPIRGVWRKAGDLLVGVGEVTNYWMRPPGALQVVRISKSDLVPVQTLVTADELSDDGHLDWDPRHSNDAVALIRTDDSKSFPDTPHAGPYMTHLCRWRFENGQFQLVGNHVIKNGLWALDGLAASVFGQDWKTLIKLVPNRSLRREVVRQMRRVTVDGGIIPIPLDGGGEALATTFEAHRYSGSKTLGAVFYFHKRHGSWRIFKVESSTSKD